MTLLLWIYLGGIAAYIHLAHGMLQNPKCEGHTKPSELMATAIIWPILVLINLVSILMGRKS